MGATQFDVGAALVPSGTTITTTTAFPGQALAPRRLPTSAWCIEVSTSNPSGTYLFTLEAATLQGGPYVEVNRLVWPSGYVGAKQIALGVNANMIAVPVQTAEFLRVQATLGGASPSLSFTSWLGKVASPPGLGAKPGDQLVTVI